MFNKLQRYKFFLDLQKYTKKRDRLLSGDGPQNQKPKFMKPLIRNLLGCKVMIRTAAKIRQFFNSQQKIG
jgi:hypothetical protein